ncbi:MAG: hypothetical protein QHH14_08070 [Clostridiales bacterium]|nr:hypothetical protein [Clostridiales bacterium]
MNKNRLGGGPDRAQIRYLSGAITAEIIAALGFSPRGAARHLLGPLFRYPSRRISTIMWEYTRDAAETDIISATGRLLAQFVDGVEARGRENVPREGPVLIASNHPGAYDAFAIVSQLPRADIKLVGSDVPFLKALPQVASRLIDTPPDAIKRMVAVRACIRQLQANGLLIIYPTGFVDPDPEVQRGASDVLKSWSPSLEIMLRRAPATRVVITVVSGVLSGQALRNPITRLAKADWEKRKLAEFLQVIEQLTFKRRFHLSPRVTFGPPISMADLDRKNLMADLIARAGAVLANHLAAFGIQ